MKGSYCNTHPPFLCQLAEIYSKFIRLKTRMKWLEEKNHGELGVDDRLLNVDDVQSLFREELGDLRDNPDFVFSNHRDDIEILFL